MFWEMKFFIAHLSNFTPSASFLKHSILHECTRKKKKKNRQNKSKKTFTISSLFSCFTSACEKEQDIHHQQKEQNPLANSPQLNPSSIAQQQQEEDPNTNTMSEQSSSSSPPQQQQQQQKVINNSSPKPPLANSNRPKKMMSVSNPAPLSATATSSALGNHQGSSSSSNNSPSVSNPPSPALSNPGKKPMFKMSLPPRQLENLHAVSLTPVTTPGAQFSSSQNQGSGANVFANMNVANLNITSSAGSFENSNNNNNNNNTAGSSDNGFFSKTNTSSSNQSSNVNNNTGFGSNAASPGGARVMSSSLNLNSFLPNGQSSGTNVTDNADLAAITSNNSNNNNGSGSFNPTVSPGGRNGVSGSSINAQQQQSSALGANKNNSSSSSSQPSAGSLSEKLSTFHANEVYPNLYIGSVVDAQNATVLRAMGITHILNVAKETDFSESVLAAKDFIKTKKVALRDNADEDITRVFADTFEFIDSAIQRGGKVLVHCFVGSSRSPTIVIAYIMKKLWQKQNSKPGKKKSQHGGGGGGELNRARDSFVDDWKTSKRESFLSIANASKQDTSVFVGEHGGAGGKSNNNSGSNSLSNTLSETALKSLTLKNVAPALKAMSDDDDDDFDTCDDDVNCEGKTWNDGDAKKAHHGTKSEKDKAIADHLNMDRNPSAGFGSGFGSGSDDSAFFSNVPALGSGFSENSKSAPSFHADGGAVQLPDSKKKSKESFYHQALTMVQEKRECYPNIGFVQALMTYEKALRSVTPPKMSPQVSPQRRSVTPTRASAKVTIAEDGDDSFSGLGANKSYSQNSHDREKRTSTASMYSQQSSYSGGPPGMSRSETMARQGTSAPHQE